MNTNAIKPWLLFNLAARLLHGHICRSPARSSSNYCAVATNHKNVPDVLSHSSQSDLLRGREHRIVDSVNDELRGDRAPREKASVKALDSCVAAFQIGELDVHLAIVVVQCETDVDDGPVLFGTLRTNIVHKVVLPVGIGFPRKSEC